MKILSIDLDYISGPAIIHNEQIMHKKELDMWPVLKWVELFDTHPGEFSHKIQIWPAGSGMLMANGVH